MKKLRKTFRKEDLSDIAKEILTMIESERNSAKNVGGCQDGKESATIVALSGDLGAGKTTLTQAIARELGITENVISPTFVIMKTYALGERKSRAKGENGGSRVRGFRRLVHIDAYRLNSQTELERLGWAELIADPANLILIEWPERVSPIIPAHARKILLSHLNAEKRTVEY